MASSDLTAAWNAYRLIMAEGPARRASAIRRLFDTGHRDLFLILRDGLDAYGPRCDRVARIEAEDAAEGRFTLDDTRQLFAALRATKSPEQQRPILLNAAEKAPAGVWNDFVRPLLLGALPLDASEVNRALGARKDAKEFMIPIFAFMRPKACGESLPMGEWWVEFPPSQDEAAVLLDGRAAPATSMTLPDEVMRDLGLLSTRMQETPCVLVGYVAQDRLYASDIVPAYDHRAGKSNHTTTARHAVLTALMTSDIIQPRSTVRLLPKKLAQMALDREELAELADEAAQDGATLCLLKHPGAAWKTGVSAKWRVGPIAMMKVNASHG